MSWDTRGDRSISFIVCAATGGVSALSSSLIIYVILRSPTKLSSIYHRLMFGMSVADIMGSIAMGLTSIPFPKDFPVEGWNKKLRGLMLGNIHTCNAQGFFFTFGVLVMFVYNGALCVYYACAIALRMKEERIRKRVEPFLHALPIAIGLGVAVPSLFLELYNPSQHDPWCTSYPYPSNCTSGFGQAEPETECIRGVDSQKSATVFLMTGIGTLFVVILVSLVLVLWRVYSTERELRKMYRKLLEKTSGHHPKYPKVALAFDGTRDASTVAVTDIIKSQNNTKVVFYQALAYILAFVLTLIFPILNLTGSKNLPLLLKLIFMPLQGFFNFIIFIGHKVYNYRRVNKEASICSVVRTLFRGALEEPMFMSRLTIVNNDRDANHFEYVVGDEADECVSYVVSAGLDDARILASDSRSGLSGFDGDASKLKSEDGKVSDGRNISTSDEDSPDVEDGGDVISFDDSLRFSSYGDAAFSTSTL
jgi:hypothetical protein